MFLFKRGETMPKVGYSEKERVQIRDALIAVGLDLMTK